MKWDDRRLHIFWIPNLVKTIAGGIESDVALVKKRLNLAQRD